MLPPPFGVSNCTLASARFPLILRITCPSRRRPRSRQPRLERSERTKRRHRYTLASPPPRSRRRSRNLQRREKDSSHSVTRIMEASRGPQDRTSALQRGERWVRKMTRRRKSKFWYMIRKSCWQICCGRYPWYT